MTGELAVAVFARVVDATALHLDGNDVSGSTIVFTAGLRIEIDATHWVLEALCRTNS